MLDLLCVGEMLIDFLPGDEQGVYIRKAGGAPANAAIAAARNGLRAGFCGRVGEDEFGRFLLNMLEENGVAMLCPAPVKEAVTTMAFVTLHEGGERSFTFARKPGADMFLTREDVAIALSHGATVVHGGSCSLSKPPASEATAYALIEAHRQGRLVSFDINYRDVMWDGNRQAAREAVGRILPHVDLLKLSEEELDFVEGEGNLPAFMRKNEISAAVVTLGAAGARCYWRDKVLEAPSRQAACIDATGAGDAFWGAFLACLVRNKIYTPAAITAAALKQGLDYGNMAGWLCVQKKGAIESLPTLEQIEAAQR